jgi:hypothetical protein
MPAARPGSYARACLRTTFLGVHMKDVFSRCGRSTPLQRGALPRVSLLTQVLALPARHGIACAAA